MKLVSTRMLEGYVRMFVGGDGVWVCPYVGVLCAVGVSVELNAHTRQ